MLSIAMVDAAVGKSYYAEDNYYTRAEAMAASVWWGKGAEDNALKGVVRAESFHFLLEGGLTGQKSLENSSKRRGGLDLTFSAPKSVSLAALVLNDKRLLEAHENAVSKALVVAEQRYANTRSGSKERRSIESSGNLIVARFNHTVSRALDPQLHTHCVLLNAVKRSDGHWRALHTDEIYRNSKFLGLIYQNELAKEAMRFGYEVEKLENGTFELKGFSNEQLQHFSKRRKQILDLGGSTQRENRLISLKNRPKKQATFRDSDLHEHWKLQIGENFKLPCKNLSNAPALSAVINLEASLSHAGSHEVSFEREKAESFLLQANLGRIDIRNIEAAFNQAKRQGILLAAKGKKLTTHDAIQREKSIISHLEQGRGRFKNIDTSAPLSKELSSGQQAAIMLSLKTNDQFMVWQGVAGAGKTFALKEVKNACLEAGYSVCGFAPSAEAAKVLGAELKFDASTVAAHLLKKTSQKSNSLWVVDEAGLLSSEDCESLMQKARREHARVLFIGDSRQLASVGAGNAFKLLQQNKAATAFLSENRRQKNQDLKKVVCDLAAGNFSDSSLQYLQSKTKVIEDKDKCIRQLVKDYLSIPIKEREESLVLAGRRDHRMQITKAIRNALVRSKALQQGTEVRILRTKDITKAEATVGTRINIGNYMAVGPQINEIQSIDHSSKTLRVKGLNYSESKEFSKIQSIYESETIPLAPGDRVVWTKNDKQIGLTNGTALTVVNVTGSHLNVSAADGKTFELDLNKPIFLDYNYVSTVYASQGKTSKYAFIYLDNAFSREGLYVATSRAKEEVNLYGTKASALSEVANKLHEKKTAIQSLAIGVKGGWSQK